MTPSRHTGRARLRNLTRREKHTLKTPLLEGELLAYGDRAARMQSEIADKREALKAHTKAAKADIDDLLREQALLLNRVATKHEDRETLCEIVFHWRSGVVRMTRLDTGEQFDERAITYDERQASLFAIDGEEPDHVDGELEAAHRAGEDDEPGE